MTVMTLLSRYEAGERDQVWHELRQLGARVREPEYRDDAEAVVRYAMTRARQNVETIIEHWTKAGYVFGEPHNEKGATTTLAPPDTETPEFARWLDATVGPLPLVARAWMEVVGDVSLQGTHPDWPSGLITDPLMVELEYKSWIDREETRRYYTSELELWQEEGDGVFTIDVAPDALHKANISGGEPYGFQVPDTCADGAFVFEDGIVVSFVEYLRLAFAWGGFPGMRNTAAGRCKLERRELGRSLLPI